MKMLLSATLVVAACHLSAGAVARELSDDVPRQVVRYADLDLTRPTGAATLYTRLLSAARDVCEPVEISKHANIECMTGAIARAVADVDAPVLTDYYLTKTGRDAQTFEAQRRERALTRSEASNR